MLLEKHAEKCPGHNSQPYGRAEGRAVVPCAKASVGVSCRIPGRLPHSGCWFNSPHAAGSPPSLRLQCCSSRSAPCSPSRCNRTPTSTSHSHQTKSFQLEKEDKGWPTKEGASLSKYLSCCHVESLRLPLCMTAQAQVLHPQPTGLDVPVVQASPFLRDAGLEQPLCPAQTPSRPASDLRTEARGSSRP